MEFEDLLAPVAGEFDVEEALDTWRWLVPQRVRALVLTALGDLFLCTLHPVLGRMSGSRRSDHPRRI